MPIAHIYIYIYIHESNEQKNKTKSRFDLLQIYDAAQTLESSSEYDPHEI
jgi:hypothetical protein